ncbi:MAG: SDR family oxidoreductase [Deltaproteobacteria bacterium]|nr:SDR family oxidoreductase [Deltaproteobacteria bacterium]MDQ3298000.1 SDR family oxidoreductase [Myxococcota bacterium]
MSELTGKRALVTGASSGIGAQLAQLIAAEGVHLVLTARRKDALDVVAAACAARGVRVDVITADLGQPDAATTLWHAATAGGPIDILVNNAGFGYFRAFVDADWLRDAELLQLNITSLVELSRRFVDARKADPGRAYLVNIASIAAYQSTPNFAVYTASKAFVRNFTEALHDELAGSPVSATCICPGGTHTEFHAAAGAGDYGWLATRSMLSAEQVARITLAAMRAGKRNVIPGVMNKISCFGVRLVPRRFASWMSRRVLGKPRAGALPARPPRAA